MHNDNNYKTIIIQIDRWESWFLSDVRCSGDSFAKNIMVVRVYWNCKYYYTLVRQEIPMGHLEKKHLYRLISHRSMLHPAHYGYNPVRHIKSTIVEDLLIIKSWRKLNVELVKGPGIYESSTVFMNHQLTVLLLTFTSFALGTGRSRGRWQGCSGTHHDVSDVYSDFVDKQVLS